MAYNAAACKTYMLNDLHAEAVDDIEEAIWLAQQLARTTGASVAITRVVDDEKIADVDPAGHVDLTFAGSNVL